MQDISDPKTVKENVESWLAIVAEHLKAIEKAMQDENYDLAEAEAYGATQKLRTARGHAEKISN